MAVSASTPTFEITVELEDDKPSTGHPQIQSSGAQESAQERPTKLPYLEQVKANHPHNLDTPSTSTRGTKRLPYITELLTGKIRRKYSRSPSRPTTELTNSPGTPQTDQGAGLGEGPECIKSGKLLKTSRVRMEGGESGPVKQKRFRLRTEQRFFRLTEEALEYYQQFNHVKVRRSYPLTSIEEVVYKDTEPNIFHLLFPKYEMVLESESEQDAREWVEKIKNAWSQWHMEVEIEFDDVEPAAQPPPYKSCDSVSDLPIPPPPAAPERGISSPGFRPRSHSAFPALLRRESTQYEDETLVRKKRKNAFRLAHLTPRLEKPKEEPKFPTKSKRHPLLATHTIVSDPESKAALDRLHSNYAMVKYPRSALGIPHERVFKVDKDNLQVLWRKTVASAFRKKSSLTLHKVIEVREGQLTDSFDKFPYEEVKEQSFSLIFEEEGSKYVKLTSIDLICDHPDNYDEWMEGLRSLVSGTKCSIFPYRYETTDPLVLWLKQNWTCKCTDHEMNSKDSMKLVKKIQPHISPEEAKALIKTAHSHQFRHTLSHGVALRWDGFTLLFNLLCNLATSTTRLNTIFLKYAIKYPELGMTTEEFKSCLVAECNWDREQIVDSELQQLMNHHDFHHRAYKKYVSKNRPLQYQICNKLLSYAGFLSFLRSRDNAAIDLDHETVYQDMTQPLSHYFINSSHNTYLEAGQLKGKSSLDAYIRALLQGCRCVEIDCWDDTFNVTGLSNKEPIIYHGFTLTSKIPFREVIHTIKDYAFRTSLYPVIISIENHCSGDQQSKMAKIFLAIMGDVLPTENLVETEGRERLPSPQELQGKIILKGSFKGEIRGGGHGTAPRPLKNTTSLASLTSQQSVPTSGGRSLSVISGSSTEDEPRSPASPNSSLAAIPLASVVSNDQTTPQEEGEHLRSHSFIFNRATGSRRSLREIRGKVEEIEKGQDDQELVFEQTSKDLKKLIVYCRSVSIKPWSWRKQQETTVSDMFSFGEPSAIKHCSKYQRDMLKCTERQIVRTYPKGVRFDSSNYDPMQMWTCGIQLVALNYQKPDLFMHLNQGYFRRNGGCGYVLKPAVMRKEDPGGTKGGSAPYSPYMEVAHPEVPAIDFEIELISGQLLCPLNKRCASFTVDIHTYGIQHDNAKMTPATNTDPLWPQWKEGEFVLNKDIIMPELCLVYFKVEAEGKKLLGQNCIALVSLKPGIKFIPMRTSGGELIPESGLFVRIKKSEHIWQPKSKSPKLTKNTSLAGKDNLETINEDPEASLNPVILKRYLRRQSTEMDEDEELMYGEEEEAYGGDHSLARRTVSSPPSITGTGGYTRRKTPSPDNKIEVEVDIEVIPPSGNSAVTTSIDSSRTRAVTIQPTYTASEESGQAEGEEEKLAPGDQREYTLTVQGSVDEERGKQSWF